MSKLEGIERQAMLARRAAELRSAGYTLSEVMLQLQKINTAECVPPLPRKELARLAQGRGPSITAQQLNARNREFRWAVKILKRVHPSTPEHEIGQWAAAYVYLWSIRQTISRQTGIANSASQRQNVERDRRIHDRYKGRQSPKQISGAEDISASQVRRILAKPRP